jgi:hypothetical protein
MNLPDTVSPGGKKDSRSWTETVGAIPENKIEN